MFTLGRRLSCRTIDSYLHPDGYGTKAPGPLGRARKPGQWQGPRIVRLAGGHLRAHQRQPLGQRTGRAGARARWQHPPFLTTRRSAGLPPGATHRHAGAWRTRKERQPLRADLPPPRRHPPQRGRLQQRARLHRADQLDPLPEVPRRPRGHQADGRRAGGKSLHAHPQRRIPLAGVGLPQEHRGQDRSSHSPQRPRPGGLRGPEALPLPARLQAARQRAQHHRVQDRRDLR